jgi:hypothetical protein
MSVLTRTIRDWATDAAVRVTVNAETGLFTYDDAPGWFPVIWPDDDDLSVYVCGLITLDASSMLLLHDTIVGA